MAPPIKFDKSEVTQVRDDESGLGEEKLTRLALLAPECSAVQEAVTHPTSH